MKIARAALVAVIMLLPGLPALPQSDSGAQPDPRLAGPTIAAQAAVLALREVEKQVLAEAVAAKLAQREADWQASFAGWCAGRPPYGLGAAVPVNGVREA